jgi:hypothetical protein
MSDGGKGSAPRPFTVTQDEYGDRFDLIFGKKKIKGDSDEFRVSEGAALKENPPKASKGGEAS